MTILQDKHQSAHMMDGAGTGMKSKRADRQTPMRTNQRMDMMQTIMRTMMDQQGGSAGAMALAAAK